MRKVISLNEKWYFHKGPTKKNQPPKSRDRNWVEVDLPHTWNSLDGQDGGNDYYRDTCWYCKEVEVALEEVEQAYLEIKGAGLAADVYVNGTLACRHENGFSPFYVDLTPYVRRNLVLIAIMVDNRPSDRIYPQAADFTFFGGLYRDINLIKVPVSHFAFGPSGTQGLTVTPVINQDGSADVTLQTAIQNPIENQTVLFTVEGVGHFSVPVTQSGSVFHLDEPHFWNGVADPFLYTLKAELKSFNEVIDSLLLHFGIRSFFVDPEAGFFLNDEPYPLRGICRHQDRQDMGWAITRKEQAQDMALIREIGANCVRLAHYQHDPYFYELCDEAGLLVWTEIPFISSFLNGPEARQNSLTQLKELVLQNYNHPSIFCWGIGNEIGMGSSDAPLLENLQALHELAQHLDPTRLTSIANLGIVRPDSPLNTITDLVGYNHYYGWYLGDVSDNGPWLDSFHEQNPMVCLGLSEYGCEGLPHYHSDTPQMQDYTEEYQSFYHEYLLEAIIARPYLFATFAWNMFDFASDGRDEGGVKGRNNKGLVTYDRKVKKDAFYLYKASWTTRPFVYICSRRFQQRATDSIAVKVYSNCPEVTLYVNHAAYARLSGNTVFIFDDVPLTMGENMLRAVYEDNEDSVIFTRTDMPNPAYSLGGVQYAGPVQDEGVSWLEEDDE